MRVFVAEVCSGLDAERLRPFRDALRSRGAAHVEDPQSAEAFVLPWTEAATVASHIQGLALDAWKDRQRSGRPHLFWLQLCSQPIPPGYRFYADAAIHLPGEFAEAARLISGAPRFTHPTQLPY